MSMETDDIVDEETILPGDVVLEMGTHRPMQVVGLHHRDAQDVSVVWDSRVNNEFYEIAPDEQVYECIYLPQGERVRIPEQVQYYPESRLRRIPPEPATGDRRTQAKIARAVLSQLVADLRNRGHEDFAEACLVYCDHIFSDPFAREIREFATVEKAEVEAGD